MKTIYTTESGTKYTWQDFIKIAKFNFKYASLLLSRLTWQHPETLVDEDLMYEEIEEYKNTFILIN